jgi:hypothetical protein
MGFEVRIRGTDELLAIRRRMKTVAAAGLGKPMARELKATTRPLSAAVRAEAAAVAPSGYAGTLTGSLRFPATVRADRVTALVTMRVYGDGRKERRDIPRLNRGQLRHPVYGRARRQKYRIENGRRVRIPGGQLIPNPWVSQAIRPGFIDRPVDRLGPELDRAMNRVIDDALRQISKG